MNTPPISPIIYIVFLSFIFVMFYLYKTSEVINKKKLFIFIIAGVAAFLGISITLYQRAKPPQQQFRLLIYPSSFGDNISSENRSMFQYIPYFATKQIYRTVNDKAVVIPYKSICNIVNFDSLSNSSYLTRIADLSGTTHFVSSCIEKQEQNSFKLHLHLYAFGKNVQSTDFAFRLNEFPNTVQQVSQSISTFIGIADSSVFELPVSSSNEYMYHIMFSRKLNLDKQFTQSLAHLNQAIRIDSTMAEGYFLTAENYFEQGVQQHTKNKKAAIQEFSSTRFYLDKAIALDSLDDEKYRLLGEYYIFNERWASAEQALLKSWQLNSNNPRVYPPYARFHEFRYNKIGFQSEEQIYQRALFLNPFYEKAYLLLSDYYLFNNNREKGIDVLNHYLKLNPNSVPTLMALSKIYLVRNNIVQALELLDKAVKLDPQNADTFYNLGIVYYNTEDYENAKRFFKRAIEINNHLNSYLYLAYISEQAGKKEEAISYLRQRIHFKTGFDDQFAEEARRHLYKLIHEDSTKGASRE